MTRFVLTDNVIEQVRGEIKAAATAVLVGAGQLYQKTAQQACPVSKVSTPGYVHLWETIGYYVDSESTYHQRWLTMYVTKDYAHFINDGTSRMPPRPFFTTGVLAVSDGIDTVVEREFAAIMAGLAGQKK